MQGVLWVITPQVNDHKHLLGTEHWRAVDKTLLETTPFEAM